MGQKAKRLATTIKNGAKNAWLNGNKTAAVADVFQYIQLRLKYSSKLTASTF